MNRFGMFIHWGIYSQLEDHEQVIARRDMSHSEYDKLVQTFNPIFYNPEEWVLLAKRAGMEYICFTTKHHDGFCMWNTKQTDFNIMNTPYGKDVLLQLSEACAKHGMRLSLYYSNPDWHEPCGYNKLSTHQWKSPEPEKGNPEQYRSFVKEQVRELLTGYGPIYTFFWDISPYYVEPSMNAFIRELQPDIFINDRGYDKGDFSTPEREVPSGQQFERMTEACQSVGEQSWGYRRNEDYYTPRFLMSSIDKIMAMGGSYLLNVGPMPDGRIPDVSRRIVEKIGSWYTRMEGSLTYHEADPFQYKIRGNDCIALKKNGKTYLHFYNGLISRTAILHKYPSIPKSVRMLNNGKYLPFEECCMPDEFNSKTGIADTEVLHIFDIPVEDYTEEPIVLEIEW